MDIDLRQFRRTMGLFATGVTVITVHANGSVHGMTANAVSSVSLDPLLVLVCVGRRARMCGMIVEAGRFAINILSEHQEELSRHFGGQPADGVCIGLSDLNGIPILDNSLATLICTVDRVVDGGDHIIVLGRVDALKSVGDEQQPLLYYAGRYHQLAAAAVPA